MTEHNHASNQTPEGVRKEREGLLRELRFARAREGRVQADLRALTEVCEHPNAFNTTHMGESCHHCPDCGGCDVR
jgi:hypothetical protein